MKIIKQEIKAKLRQLTANWSVNYVDESTFQIENELASHVANEIQKEIDFDVMDSMLGYQYQYVFSSPVVNEDDIGKWCKDNKFKYYHLGTRWKFKTQKELSWFILRWA